MRVFLTGATGFIGRALCARLVEGGHAVSAWVRDPEAARSSLPGSATLAAASADGAGLAAAMQGAEAVVNLAGEPLFPGRWTRERRARFESSRVGLTRSLVDAMRGLEPRPRVFVSASAIGYYGDRGDELLREDSAPGDDFLARLCRAWEDAAQEATELGVRVVTPRIGLVLGRDGGVLAQLLLPFKLGVGGRLGAGGHYMSWIHRADLSRLFEAMLSDARYRGPVNAVGPNPVTNRTFTAALGRALRRPTLLPVPEAALQLMFGEAAATVLSSQRVEPAVAQSLGFRFDHPELSRALQDLLGATS